MATAAHIARLRAQCLAYNLRGREALDRYSDEELTRVYNGIGPEWFPEDLRRAVDDLNPDFECVALIHDVEFEESDGTSAGFLAANVELRDNGRAVADAKYRWWDLRRYIRRAQASAYASLCDRFGWEVWTRYSDARKQLKGDV